MHECRRCVATHNIQQGISYAVVLLREIGIIQATDYVRVVAVEAPRRLWMRYRSMVDTMNITNVDRDASGLSLGDVWGVVVFQMPELDQNIGARRDGFEQRLHIVEINFRCNGDPGQTLRRRGPRAMSWPTR